MFTLLSADAVARSGMEGSGCERDCHERVEPLPGWCSVWRRERAGGDWVVEGSVIADAVLAEAVG
jgi:hypothetical protein